MKHTRSESGAAVFIRAVVLGAALSAAVIAAACTLCALLIKNQLLPEHASMICSGVILAASTAAGCMLSQKLAGRGRLPVSLSTAAVLLLLLVAFRMLTRNGTGSTWYSLPIAAACAVVCALLGAGRA